MSTTLNTQKKSDNFKKLIIAASIAIPLVVAVLFKVKVTGVDFGFLPPIYATINGITAFFLVIALIAIKRKNIVLHQTMVKLSLVLSLLFLACYVAYHMTSDPTPYGGESKVLYYTILISHIILSIAVIPLVLFTYLFAWQGDFVKHRKYAKIAWPLWFYVAVTGVVVYWMIAPYYK